MDFLQDIKVLKPMRDKLRGQYQDYGVQEDFDIRNFSKLHDRLSDLELLIKHYTYCVVFKERWSYIFWLKLTRRIISLWLDAARDKLTEERDSYLWVALKGGRDLGLQVDIYNNLNKLTKEVDLFESELNLHTVEKNELERLSKKKTKS